MKYHHFISILAFAVLLLLSSSCTKLFGEALIDISDNSLELDYTDYATNYFTITSTKSWKASSSKGWCHVYPESGKGSEQPQKIEVTCRENSDTSPREAVITITSGDVVQTVKVHQERSGFLSLNKNSVTLTNAKQNVIIDVSSTEDFEVSIPAPYDQTWISVVSTKAVSKNQVVLQIEEQPLESGAYLDWKRTGRVEVWAYGRGGQYFCEQFYITQMFEEQIMLDTHQIDVNWKSQGASIGFFTNITDYKVIIPDYASSWIQVSQTKSAGHRVGLHIVENTSYDARQAVVSISAPDDSIQENVLVTQGGAFLLEWEDLYYFAHTEACDIQCQVTTNYPEFIKQDISDRPDWIQIDTLQDGYKTCYTFHIDENKDTRARKWETQALIEFPIGWWAPWESNEISITQLGTGYNKIQMTVNSDGIPWTKIEHSAEDYSFFLESEPNSASWTIMPVKYATDGEHMVTYYYYNLDSITIPGYGVTELDLTEYSTK